MKKPEWLNIFRDNTKDSTPFKGGLEQADFTSRTYIKQLRQRPDKIVKLSSRELAVPGKEKLDERLRRYQRGRELFYELRDKYGINVPEIQYVVGEDEGQIRIFTITDRIDGHDLGHIKTYETDLRAKEVDGLFGKIVDYYAAKFASGEEFLWDTTGGLQFVYGTNRAHPKINSQGLPQKELYLIDFDPRYTGRPSEIFDCLDDIVENIREVEGVFMAELSGAREKLLKFLGSIAEDNPHYWRAVNLSKKIGKRKELAA